MCKFSTATQKARNVSFTLLTSLQQKCKNYVHVRRACRTTSMCPVRLDGRTTDPSVVQTDSQSVGLLSQLGPWNRTPTIDRKDMSVYASLYSMG